MFFGGFVFVSVFSLLSRVNCSRKTFPETFYKLKTSAESDFLFPLMELYPGMYFFGGKMQGDGWQHSPVTAEHSEDSEF